ncbi:hypothetical protein AGLY_000404 [Aphis glycines]|uniref:Uncharacterized protein n=1 Tax=Aphis glycines TaxID=307491 RepID=A0A6G0U6W4_APHGL|nr:hypothetical protein AGLY_000404 [Aphis glycines]
MLTALIEFCRMAEILNFPGPCPYPLVSNFFEYNHLNKMLSSSSFPNVSRDGIPSILIWFILSLRFWSVDNCGYRSANISNIFGWHESNRNESVLDNVLHSGSCEIVLPRLEALVKGLCDLDSTIGETLVKSELSIRPFDCVNFSEFSHVSVQFSHTLDCLAFSLLSAANLYTESRSTGCDSARQDKPLQSMNILTIIEPRLTVSLGTRALIIEGFATISRATLNFIKINAKNINRKYPQITLIINLTLERLIRTSKIFTIDSSEALSSCKISSVLCKISAARLRFKNKTIPYKKKFSEYLRKCSIKPESQNLKEH